MAVARSYVLVAFVMVMLRDSISLRIRVASRWTSCPFAAAFFSASRIWFACAGTRVLNHWSSSAGVQVFCVVLFMVVVF